MYTLSVFFFFSEHKLILQHQLTSSNIDQLQQSLFPTWFHERVIIILKDFITLHLMYMHILFEIFKRRLVNYVMRICQMYLMNCMHYLVVQMLVSTLIVHTLSTVSSSSLSHAMIGVKPKIVELLVQEHMPVLKMIITDT